MNLTNTYHMLLQILAISTHTTFPYSCSCCSGVWSHHVHRYWVRRCCCDVPDCETYHDHTTCHCVLQYFTRHCHR